MDSTEIAANLTDRLAAETKRADKAERANGLLLTLIAETADFLEQFYPQEIVVIGRLRRLPEMIERIVERGAEDEVDSR